MGTLLSVNNLKLQFKNRKSSIQVVHGVSFNLNKGEILGIAGESGCGKSVTSLSLLGLLPENGFISDGCIQFDGKTISKISEDEMMGIRGNEISMIFQDPLSSLNPTMTIGKQIMEAFFTHQKISKPDCEKNAIHLLKSVGIPSPTKRFYEYPHQLSGGMRQRVMIAMALACKPKLLIADEPTTALDVSIQAQILHLIKDLNQEHETAVILISHDMGVIAEIADKVLIMYAGVGVEYGTVYQVFKSPKHPYTKGLLKSIPHLDSDYETLEVIEGVVPDPNNMPVGCHYAPRCKHAMDICLKEKPRHFIHENTKVACFLYEDCEDAQ